MIYESIIIPQSEMTDHVTDIFYLTYQLISYTVILKILENNTVTFIASS